jgi:hypothetical protein
MLLLPFLLVYLAFSGLLRLFRKLISHPVQLVFSSSKQMPEGFLFDPVVVALFALSVHLALQRILKNHIHGAMEVCLFDLLDLSLVEPAVLDLDDWVLTSTRLLGGLGQSFFGLRLHSLSLRLSVYFKHLMLLLRVRFLA